jgi:hypothetical protein
LPKKLVAIERHGPGNYQVLELPVREKYEIWPSRQLGTYMDGHWDEDDYKHVYPQAIVDDLAARKGNS